MGRFAWLALAILLSGCFGNAGPAAREQVDGGGLLSFAPALDVDLGRLGEPRIVADPAGGAWLVALGIRDASSAPSNSGHLYRYPGGGGIWTPVVGLSDRLASDSIGDVDLAVGPDGWQHAAILSSDSILVTRYHPSALAWDGLREISKASRLADRPWIASDPSGAVLTAWLERPASAGGPDLAGGHQAGRQLVFRSSTDAGYTWEPEVRLGANIGWVGPAIAAGGHGLFLIPFTETRPSVVQAPAAVVEDTGLAAQVMLARVDAANGKWDAQPTSAVVFRNAATGEWAGTLMAPVVTVTGDGTIVLAWSEENEPERRGEEPGATVMVATSPDGGVTWTAPVPLSTTTAVMPWIVAGRGSQFAVAFYSANAASTRPVPPEHHSLPASWDVVVVFGDAAFAGQPVLERVTAAAGVHEGGICTRGGSCLWRHVTALTNTWTQRAEHHAGIDSRELLDFLSMDVVAGRVVVAYVNTVQAGGASPAQAAKTVIQASIQASGPLLGSLEPVDAAQARRDWAPVGSAD